MAQKLFIGGLSFSTSTDRLRETFAQAGQVESAAVVTDRDTGQSRGFGFVEMATVEEANEAITRFNGKELDGRTMIAFGGAAPLHAAAVAEKLGIDRIVVPADAGVGSAVGFLLAPVAYEVVRSSYQRLSALDCDAVNAVFRSMRAEALNVLRQALPKEELSETCFAFARYVGQGHEIRLTLPNGTLSPGDETQLLANFERAYATHYGRTVPGLDVEVLTWTMSMSEPAGAVEPAPGAES